MPIGLGPAISSSQLQTPKDRLPVSTQSWECGGQRGRCSRKGPEICHYLTELGGWDIRPAALERRAPGLAVNQEIAGLYSSVLWGARKLAHTPSRGRPTEVSAVQ